MENNKLIAEFMGMEDHQEMGEYFAPNYHKSWDCLMSVLQKCRQENQLEYFDKVYYALEECDINLTYKAVVEFIKQYNK